MSRLTTRILIALSILSIVGIVSTQVYWVRKAYELRERQFLQTVTKALSEVARRVARPETGVPVGVQVVTLSPSYYLVNLDAPIDPQKLDFFLGAELEIHQILTTFEYGVYDNNAGQIIYENSSRQPDQPALSAGKNKPSASSPYYFVVRFPNQVQYLTQQLDNWILASLIVLLLTCFFMYLFYRMLTQKNQTDDQREFINNMTHELQTPITSIKIAADVLSSPKIIEQPERMLKYVRMVQEETLRLQQQVETVLTVARSDNKGAFKLNQVPIDMHELLFHLAERHGDYLHLELEAHYPIVQADRLHLTNVLGNLVDNAVKYTPANPFIQLITRNENGQFVLFVQDNGIGIAPEHQPHIFNAYYRAPGTNTHSVKGFGLGLSYVQKIVKAHRWKLSVSSAPGQGSTFSIRIPQPTVQPIRSQKELRVKN
ncbi:sensor histidine kinase [Larkinella humicola]|uniref:histidine kinase n=1 Tax=Larkinella humicola TaxID=2607654 RepID=A0A5N1JSX5_9BACT|nr:HAMP domain-containing sensor histidine kinase [Larkinella humicola]KAA9357422.1 HAMP domain-containing histidine kinase [Larkinella humicola]